MIRQYFYKIILFLILASALFSRLFLFSQEGFITTDGVSYALAGKSLIENGKYEIFGSPQIIFPPGYPAAIGIADHFFNNLLFSARFVSFVAGFLSIYLFYLIGKQLYNKETGLFASLFAATHWMMITMSVVSMSESLYLFFVLLIIHLYLKIISKYEISRAILLGILVAIAYLVRPEGILFLILAFIFLKQKNKNLRLKEAIKGCFIIIFSFVFTAAPYFYFLYQNTGKLNITAKSKPNLITGIVLDGKEISDTGKNNANFYEKTFSHYDEKTNSIKIPEKFKNISVKSSIFSNPIGFLKRYCNGLKSEIKVLFDDYDLGLFLIPIIFLLAFAPKFKEREQLKKSFILFLFSILFILLFPIFHLESRYLLPVLIFIILLSSLGCSLGRKFTLLKIGKYKISSTILFNGVKFVVLYIILINFAVSPYVIKLHSHPEHKKAGEYLKNNSDYNSKRDIIMSRKPFVGFYAQSQKNGVSIPYTNPENILKFAKARNVSYIVIDERFLKVRDNYNEMANLDKYSNDIKIFYEDNYVKPIKIFKVLDDKQ